MKKIIVAVAMLMTGPFIAVNARPVHASIGKEQRKQLRKERREKRRNIRLHSVSSLTSSQFNIDFPNATNIEWTSGVLDEASFLDKRVARTAYYDWDNELVGTTTKVNYTDLPLKARQLISKKYPGYSVQKVILFDDNETNDTDMFLFNSSFDDEDTWFPELTKGTEKIILKVRTNGDVSFFKEYK